jgi:hypothetical protein
MKVIFETADEIEIEIEWIDKLPKLNKYFLFNGAVFFVYNIIWEPYVLYNITLYRPKLILH